MAAWFSAAPISFVPDTQLYKLGFDESVTQWTDINPASQGLDPRDLTFFNDAVWFTGEIPQLWKLGSDGSVTQWTAINPGGGGLFAGQDPDMTTFNNALWFDGFTGTQGFQLYKLGFDGSVTLWTALNTAGGGLEPFNMTVFNDAL
jgi:hypothetical protein